MKNRKKDKTESVLYFAIFTLFSIWMAAVIYNFSFDNIAQEYSTTVSAIDINK
ncbi:hypothetical protein HYW53_01975 [Candidatus Giovannonibacteria bacterium]|nr:hypothetical protein [Candidatus Giovannonibacteria bacterium]